MQVQECSLLEHIKLAFFWKFKKKTWRTMLGSGLCLPQIKQFVLKSYRFHAEKMITSTNIFTSTILDWETMILKLILTSITESCTQLEIGKNISVQNDYLYKVNDLY